MSDLTGAATEVYQTCDSVVVDVATDTTTVYLGKGALMGYVVNTALSAHVNVFADDTTTLFSTVASQAAGSYVLLPGIRFYTSLVFNPNDSATGNVTIFYKKL